MTNLNVMKNSILITGSKKRTPLTGIIMFFATIGEAALDGFGHVGLHNISTVGLGTILIQFAIQSTLHTLGITFANTIDTIFRTFDIIVVSTIGLMISAYFISEKAENVVSLYNDKRSKMSAREKLLNTTNTKRRIIEFIADTYALDLEQ